MTVCPYTGNQDTTHRTCPWCAITHNRPHFWERFIWRWMHR